MRYAVCGKRYAVCGMRCAVYGMRYAVCGVRYAVCGKWDGVEVSGTESMVVVDSFRPSANCDPHLDHSVPADAPVQPPRYRRAAS